MKTMLLVTLVLLLGRGAGAMAHLKTDVVHMYNGDRITGEIKTLLHGLLTIKTDSMGTLNIEWQDISTIESNYNYELRLSDGTRIFGSINQAERAGQLSVSDLDGDHNFEWIEVVDMRPIEDHWTDRLDVYLSLGYSYTKATSVTQTTFNTEISYGDEDAKNTLTARETHSVTEETVSRSSKANYTREVWTSRSGRFRSSWASYESNDELGLQHRYAIGGGLGKMFIDNHRMRWSATAGAQILTEQDNSGAENEAVEGVLSSDFKLWQFNTPKLDLNWSFNFYPNLKDSERLRGDTDLRLSWEIIKDLYWDITAYGTFDNASETDNTSDYGITTGIGWSY